jgi:hypothetical protein
MAFAPDYATSGRLYVFYTDLGGDLRVDEFRVSTADPDRADPASRRLLLAIEHSANTNHNGGQLQFGPDGYLYVSTGDGGGGGDPDGNGQSLGTLLGKLLRIDPVPEGPAPAAESPAAESPAAQSPAAGADLLAPSVTVRFPRRQRLLRRRAVIGYLRSSETGTVVAGGSVRVAGSRLHLPLRAVRRGVVAGQRYRLVLRLSRRARAALRRAFARRRRVTARVVITVNDGAGNSTRVRRAVRARR